MTDDTRRRIVEAARQTVIQRGYEQTSIKEIAAAAGVAPGLLHYYFRSKEDLLIAAIERACKEAEESFGHLSGLEAAQAGLQKLKEQNNDVALLFLEMVSVGLHNPRVAAAVRELINADRAYIEGLARALIPERPPAEQSALAAVVWSGMIGIHIQRLFDPDLDIDAVVDAFAELAMSPVATANRSDRRP